MFCPARGAKKRCQLMDYLGVYIFFNSEPYLGRSKESDNQGLKVQVKRTFKSYSYLSQETKQTNKQRNKKKTDKFSLNFYWIPSASMQQVPRPPTSKSMSPYSVVSCFSTPRSGATKRQTKIVTYYLSALRLP